MKWLQIMVFQLHNKVILNVDDETCVIHGVRTLSTEVIKEYEAGSLIFDLNGEFYCV